MWPVLLPSLATAGGFQHLHSEQATATSFLNAAARCSSTATRPGACGGRWPGARESVAGALALGLEVAARGEELPGGAPLLEAQLEHAVHARVPHLALRQREAQAVGGRPLVPTTNWRSPRAASGSPAGVCGAKRPGCERFWSTWDCPWQVPRSSSPVPLQTPMRLPWRYTR